MGPSHAVLLCVFYIFHSDFYISFNFYTLVIFSFYILLLKISVFRCVLGCSVSRDLSTNRPRPCRIFTERNSIQHHSIFRGNVSAVPSFVGQLLSLYPKTAEVISKMLWRARWIQYVYGSDSSVSNAPCSFC